jgi:hypothetical protein
MKLKKDSIATNLNEFWFVHDNVECTKSRIKKIRTYNFRTMKRGNVCRNFN